GTWLAGKVERAGADEQGERFRARRYAAAKVGQALIGAVAAALKENLVTERFIQRCDGFQSSADSAVINGKRATRAVDTRQTQRNAGALDRFNVDAAGIHALIVVERRRPERQRIADLERRGLPGNQAVADRVAFAKRVVVELRQLHPHLGGGRA